MVFLLRLKNIPMPLEAKQGLYSLKFGLMEQEYLLNLVLIRIRIMQQQKRPCS